MIEGLRLELRDVAPIARADLDINRINIVGGKNGTGKSTASKLLYCFLKANSSDNDILLTFTLKKELDDIYKEFNSRYFKDPSVSELTHKIKRKDSSIHEKNHNGIMDPNDFEEDMIKYNVLGGPNDYRNPLDHVDYGDNMFNYLEDNSSYDYGMFDDNDSWDSNDYGFDMMEGYYESDEYVSDMMEEAYYSDLADEYYEDETVGDRIENPYDSEIIHNIRRLWNMLNYHDYDDFKEVIDFFKSIEDPITEILETEALRESKRPVPLFSPSDTRSFEILLSKWNKIKRILHSYEDYSSDFFKEVMKDLISSEFNIDFTNDPVRNKRLGRPNYRIKHAKLFDSLNSNFSFEVNLNDIEKEFESEGEFLVNNVFYLESYSILDSYAFLKEEYLHIEELKKYLKKRGTPSASMLLSSYNFDGKLEKRVNQIIGGRIVNGASGRLRFEGSGNYSTMKNTASGVKQLAVIQTLLHNGFLEENSVLIIDEPEVNLHPEWQIKLAQILVLLAKDGNIIIYINSHSPMFIEAMDTFSEYYDFEDYVNYYLSEEIECDESEVSSEKSEKDENKVTSLRQLREESISEKSKNDENTVIFERVSNDVLKDENKVTSLRQLREESISEKSKNDENRVIFKRIPNDELYVIYDNLGDPFDILDKVRLMKGKKGADDDFYI